MDNTIHDGRRWLLGVVGYYSDTVVNYMSMLAVRKDIGHIDSYLVAVVVVVSVKWLLCLLSPTL